MIYSLITIWLGVNSLGESRTLIIIYFSYSYVICRYWGHSMGVIPGLVSIPVVKSFCVLFVYYGFLWEFHFAASLLLQLSITFFDCYFFLLNTRIAFFLVIL